MDWITVKEYEDITYKKCNGVARIAFNRPDVRNAFVQNDIRTIQCIL
jgi:naphthoate synthase